MGAACYRTNVTIANGWQCSNCDERTIEVDNVTVTAGAFPLPPPWSDGYTYFAFSAGNYSFAEFSVY